MRPTVHRSDERPPRRRRFPRPLAVALTLAACTAPAAAPQVGPADFRIEGDPTSSFGARWSWRGRHEGVEYDLAGVLYRPQGAGPFPAVILSHGAGGSAAQYARRLAPDMVRWGLVAIAVNYSHAEDVPRGAPGSPDERGASRANVLRARMTYELLRSLEYVDTTRIAAHGHSMGAYVTVALVAAYPGAVRVASHTAGGVRPPRIIAGPAPTEAMARAIRTPYQIHHGELDDVVSLGYAERLKSVLERNRVPHELHVYRGTDHVGVARAPEMLERVRRWYASHGMF